MTDELECMCIECGISLYLPRDLITLGDHDEEGNTLVRAPFCTECGGRLRVVGKAGDEPFYRVQERAPNGDAQAK
jgi:hypothetical protein